MTIKEQDRNQQQLQQQRPITAPSVGRRQVITPGGRLSFSPASFLEYNSATYFPERQSSFKDTKKRILDSHDDNDGYTSYLVDKNGNAYEPYSLAWRYLGMYLDCDLEQDEDDDDDNNNDKEERRYLGSGSGDGDCERVLLWAAYVDPRYRGGSIGEYQFYDLETNSWDKSSCRTRRCARMDCHEPNSHFKLVGVFKESDGLEDWAEQLFKHEGYCLWDSDTYETMQERREKWPTYCIQLYYTVDGDGNTLYTHLKPDKEGNITMGIYTDEKCTQESSMTFFDYIIAFYNYYYGNEDEGLQAASYWNTSIATWNTHMNTYKICQPCRAYNLGKFDYDQENGDSKDGSKDDKRRFLENNDGEGDEEQWGFNCYDDAGYTNCNQCYKFETKTDLEPVYVEDLARASKQGTILEIVVDGKRYGNGGFRNSFPDLPVTTLVVFGIVACGILYFAYQNRRKAMEAIGLLRESLFQDKFDETANGSNRNSKDEVDSTLTSSGSSSATTSGYYSEFSDSSMSFMGVPWSYCAPIEMQDSVDSCSIYTGHSLSSTSQDFCSCQELESSSCDSSKRKRRGNERIKWIEFRNSLLPNNTGDSEDSRWSDLQRRILYPEETRWMDLRNKILGPSHSSLPDHHVSELSSNTATHSGGITSTNNTYSHDEDHGGETAESAIASNANAVNIGHQEFPEDEVDGCTNRELAQEDTGPSLAMEGSSLSGINKDKSRNKSHTQSSTHDIGRQEFPKDEVDGGYTNQEHTQEENKQNPSALSTAHDNVLSTINEDSDNSSSDEDRFEILKRQLLSTSTDLVDDRWSTLQRDLLEVKSDELLPGESEDSFHSASP